jgi:hypothetical protein
LTKGRDKNGGRKSWKVSGASLINLLLGKIKWVRGVL